MERSQRVVDSERERLRVKGLSAAVASQSGVVWAGVSGQSTVANRITPDMLFGLGSVTKTYIAALIMQFVDEGAFSLDDPVGDWITKLGRIDPTIAIRRLLHHTSGLYRYQIKPEYLAAIYQQPERVWAAQEIVDEFQGEPNCKVDPGWGESALDYVLLGMIIEKAAESAASRVLRTRLLSPLGLDDTFLYPDEGYPVERMAHMWWAAAGASEPVDVVAGAGKLPLAGLFSSLWTSGALHATASDLARFAQALFTGAVVSPRSLEEMLKPGPELGVGVRYGYSVVIESSGGEPRYWHSGGAGFSSIFSYSPEQGQSVAVLCNQMVDLRPVARALESAVA